MLVVETSMAIAARNSERIAARRSAVRRRRWSSGHIWSYGPPARRADWTLGVKVAFSISRRISGIMTPRGRHRAQTICRQNLAGSGISEIAVEESRSTEKRIDRRDVGKRDTARF